MLQATSTTEVLRAPPATDDVRPRPALLRALGRSEPPPVVEIQGETFCLVELLKHDSWAATAIYESPSRKALCKFNRQQAIFTIPMRWLGRLLAARERGFHDRLDGIAGIAPSLGAVCIDGKPLQHAVARTFIDGHALAEGEWVDDDFFPRFQDLLADVHRQHVAHVDLHKRENILVDTAGRPYLIDFQISFALPAKSRLATALFGGLLHLLQRCDDYHLLKHQIKHRPDQAGLTFRDIESLRPWWIRLHRWFAVPFRSFRRGLLIRLGIRSTSGHAFSEAFPEIAHRRAAA